MTEQAPEATADEAPAADLPPMRWAFYNLTGGRVMSMSTRLTNEEIMTRFRDAYNDDEILLFEFPSGNGHAFPARQVVGLNTRLLKPYENPMNVPPS